MIQRSYISLNRCLILFLRSSSEERYLEFVRQHPGYVNRIPQYLIASYIDITPEYLSRIRGKLAVSGAWFIDTDQAVFLTLFKADHSLTVYFSDVSYET